MYQVNTSKDVLPPHTGILCNLHLFPLNLLDHDGVFEIDIVPLDILEDTAHCLLRLVFLLFASIVPGGFGDKGDKEYPDAKCHPFRVDSFEVVVGVGLDRQPLNASILNANFAWRKVYSQH